MQGWRMAVVATIATVMLVATCLVAGLGGTAFAWSEGGTLEGLTFRVSGELATGRDIDPDTAYNPATGEYLVVWSDQRNLASSGRDIFGQLVAGDGSKVGSNFRISGAGATYDESTPAVSYNSDSDEFLVVWVDKRNHFYGYDVYGRRVSAAGSPVGSDFFIDDPAADVQRSGYFTPSPTWLTAPILRSIWWCGAIGPSGSTWED